MPSAFSRLDFFKRVPKDLTEPTFCGALCMPFIYDFLQCSI